MQRDGSSERLALNPHRPAGQHPGARPHDPIGQSQLHAGRRAAITAMRDAKLQRGERAGFGLFRVQRGVAISHPAGGADSNAHQRRQQLSYQHVRSPCFAS